MVGGIVIFQELGLTCKLLSIFAPYSYSKFCKHFKILVDFKICDQNLPKFRHFFKEQKQHFIHLINESIKVFLCQK